MERLLIVYYIQRAVLQGSAYCKGTRIYVYLNTHTILWYIYTHLSDMYTYIHEHPICSIIFSLYIHIYIHNFFWTMV